VSNGPPGSTWAGPPAEPLNANSTRGRRFLELLHGRGFAYGIVLGSVGALVAGAAVHSLALAVGGPLAVAAVAVLLALATADRRAERDFFRAYAAAHGFAYVGTTAPLPLTPLLGAGDRRRCEHWLKGPLTDGLECGLGHYTFEVRERDSGGRQRPETRHFTICVVDLEAHVEAAIRMFPAIFLCRRRGVFGMLDGRQWLSHTNRHELELESAKLCERYELWVDDGQDELLLHQLFAPSFEVLLAEHPLAPCFEFRAGTLVTYVERKLEDEGHLDWMREVTAKIAERFAAEVAEEQASGGLKVSLR
jgi:PAS domain-containing protein